jgi:hypothetical protein
MLDLQYMRTLSYACYGGATPGEVLWAARESRHGDRDGYVRAWTKLGRRVARQARDAADAGRQLTARSSFLRAYKYLRAAEFYADRRAARSVS